MMNLDVLGRERPTPDVRLSRVAITSWVVFCASLFPVLPASAADCGTASNWHVGFNSSSQSTSRTDLMGVRTTLDVQLPAFCAGGGSKNFTNAYVMTKASNPNHGYAQGGYERGPSGSSHPGLRNFAQVSNAGEFDTWYGVKISAGQTNRYKVENFRDTAPLINDVWVYVNGNVKLQGSTSLWPAPFYIELSGEARYREDDVPGTSADRVRFDSLRYKDKDTGNWGDMPGGIFSQSSDSNKWHSNSVSPTRKQIWSNPTN